MNSFKPDEWDQLFEGAASDESGLDIKEAVSLNKYILAAMKMLSTKDQKTQQLVSYAVLLKTQLKMNQCYGQGLILKSAFEKGEVLAN